MDTDSYLIGRQPIVDRLEKIQYYELLFRSHGSPAVASITSAQQATSQVVVNTLSGFKMEEILGSYMGFINIDADMLISDAVELLPATMIGLELLDSVAITPAVIQRCRELKSRGYLLALDDHRYVPEYEALYDGVVDIVKIDLATTPLESVYNMVDRFKRYPVRLLAEKIDSRHSYIRSRSMGFELFQGYFFARPSLLQKKRLEDSANTFFKLLQLLNENAEISQIEQVFKHSPSLTYKLLLLVNSVAFGRCEKIRTVRHALTLIGMQHLKRWVQLALFANDGSQDLDNALMDMVAVRAAFLEELACLHPATASSPSAADEAFMVGTLSLLGDNFDISIDQAITGLNLSDDIKHALFDRSGGLGELLQIVELIEQLELDLASELLQKSGIPLLKVFDCQKKAYSWRAAFF